MATIVTSISMTAVTLLVGLYLTQRCISLALWGTWLVLPALNDIVELSAGPMVSHLLVSLLPEHVEIELLTDAS